jgi:MFS transporter, DHA1 family, multidrug resistance protein
LLGCVALIASPMPIVFYIYGKKIRGKSKFAPAPDIQQDKRRDEEARLQSGEGDGDSNGKGDAEKENGGSMA